MVTDAALEINSANKFANECFQQILKVHTALKWKIWLSILYRSLQFQGDCLGPLAPLEIGPLIS